MISLKISDLNDDNSFPIDPKGDLNITFLSTSYKL